ncbi:MAG: CoB--CoM heterodisulfide reductase iron-sulfur subunit B family protein [Candidatus Helarchaeota archaeon]
MKKAIPEKGIYLFKSCMIGMEYPGAEESVRFIFNKLGIDYFDDPKQSCCSGMGINLDVVSPLITTVLSARNFTLAHQSNHPYLTTLCSTCYGVNKEACEWIHNNSKLREQVEEILQKVGLEFKVEYMNHENVFHVIEFLYKWREKISRNLKMDLSNIKIATHHGCHFFKLFPGEVRGDPENLTIMDELVNSVGADLIPWYNEKNTCCGSGFRHRIMKPELANKAGFDKLRSVKNEGAEILVNMCPMCHFQFDRYNSEYKKLNGNDLGLIHLNIAQLIALALGADPYKVVGIQTHSVKVEPLLKKLNVLIEKKI